MLYLEIDNELWAWSAKSACTSVKKSRLLRLGVDNPSNARIHNNKDYCRTVSEKSYSNYVWWIRNPYTRFISGYLDICVQRGNLANLTLRDFISNFDFYNKHMADVEHHFELQSKNYVERDWTLIDVERYNFGFPKSDHSNSYTLTLDSDLSVLDIPVHKMPIKPSFKRKCFLIDEVLSFVETHYKQDFILLKKHGITFNASICD